MLSDDADVVGFAREGKEETPRLMRGHPLRPHGVRQDALRWSRHAGEEWSASSATIRPQSVVDDGTLTGTVSDGGLSVYAPRA